jgi:serine O-acetyltransferase
MRKNTFMNLQEWIKQNLPQVVEDLSANITGSHYMETGDYLGLAGRREIYDILDDFLSLLFPGCYSRDNVKRENINFYVDETLRHIMFKFLKPLENSFHTYCSEESGCDRTQCGERAEKALMTLVNDLPQIRTTLLEDVEAALEGDPAAKSFEEVVLSYPCIEAISTYRLAHCLYRENVPVIPRIMCERAHSTTGIDINPGAEIGRRFFIDHGTGVVIGETCRIGNNVKIYQGVTLGALSPLDKKGKRRKGEKRHPDIEDDVIIYANATILGGKTVIGKGSVIGGNTWITSSVPTGSVINGNNT